MVLGLICLEARTDFKNAFTLSSHRINRRQSKACIKLGTHYYLSFLIKFLMDQFQVSRFEGVSRLKKRLRDDGFENVKAAKRVHAKS